MKVSGQALVQGHPVSLVPMSLLRAGEHGKVGEIVGGGEMVHRLREMGLCDGAQVQMIRPGSPCIIRLHGQRLGMRVDELVHVLVRVAAAAAS